MLHKIIQLLVIHLSLVRFFKAHISQIIDFVLETL